MLKGKLKFSDSPNIRYDVKNNSVTKAMYDVELQFTAISVCGQVPCNIGQRLATIRVLRHAGGGTSGDWGN